MEPTRTTGEHTNSIKHLAPRGFKPGTLMQATAVTPSVVVLYFAVRNLEPYMPKGQVEMVPRSPYVRQNHSRTHFPPAFPCGASPIHVRPCIDRQQQSMYRRIQPPSPPEIIDLFSSQSSIFISFLCFFLFICRAKCGMSP